MKKFYKKIGAFGDGKGNCSFCLWAPLKKNIEVIIYSPEPKNYPLQMDDEGYWSTTLSNIDRDARYLYKIDDNLERPDPASLFQPEGVHKSSQIVSNTFDWKDNNWKGKALKDLIIYELHVGTFTAKGTFEGVIEKLDYLKDLGISAIEIMPVAEFPGKRGWGYDGVYPFAVHHTYGGSIGLKSLVNAAHSKGIAVILDVVYNHIGPDGNYLRDFAPYFTDKYKTPWGESLNYDGPYSDGVRNFFMQNALMWLNDFHIDGLRMDAVHAIFDSSAMHFLKDVKKEVKDLEQALGKKKFLVAEIDLNDPKYINPVEKGGYGLDGQWVDEFHHALHSALTGDTDGYYEDFGSLYHLEKAFKNTYVYNGNYSKHRKKLFGTEPEHNTYDQFVVFTQNHDQVGNRAIGDRLTTTLSFEQLKLAAATVLLSPYVPMLFMGEEYGEKNPFLYFVDHNPELAQIVREGRKKEFSYFNFKDEFPDPQSDETFTKSILSWKTEEDYAAALLAFYKFLIQFKVNNPIMQTRERASMVVHPVNEGKVLSFERIYNTGRLIIILNFNNQKDQFVNTTPFSYKKIFDSTAEKWRGQGEISQNDISVNGTVDLNPLSAVVYEKTK